MPSANLPTCKLISSVLGFERLYNPENMARNRLLPTQIFAILATGIAVSALLLAGAMQLHVNKSLDYGGGPDKEAQMIRDWAAIAGLVLLPLSIGLIMRQKWAFWGMLSVLWLAAIAWLGLVYMIFESEETEAWKRLLGVSVIVYSLLGCGILFLNNDRVRELFHDAAMPSPAQETPDEPQYP